MRGIPGNLKHGHARRIGNTPEYKVWSAMRSRCNNPRHASWKHYGGRGITVCERWSLFSNFIEDMGMRPSKKHSIDRIDNNGNYEPSNCRWATWKEQGRNRRDNKVITYRGENRPLSEWVEILGVDAKIVDSRINRLGWSTEEAFETPPKFKSSLTKDQVQEIRVLAKANIPQRRIAARFGIDHKTVKDILSGKNWSHLAEPVLEDFLQRPLKYDTDTVAMRVKWSFEKGISPSQEDLEILAKEYLRFRLSLDRESGRDAI